jgi:hypothetical protein
MNDRLRHDIMLNAASLSKPSSASTMYNSEALLTTM